MVSAVDYMHRLGLAHRDLRIENIIINETTREVTFIDFGHATSFKVDKHFQDSDNSLFLQDKLLPASTAKNNTLAC